MMKPTECAVDGVKYVAMDSATIFGCDGCTAECDAYLCYSLKSESDEVCLDPGKWSVIWIKKDPQ